LKINYEENEDVQQIKIVTLTNQYQFFPMLDGETMEDMLWKNEGFSKRARESKHSHFKARMNLKLLESMPKVWEAKINGY